jgi:hypothetical protein
MLKSTKKMIIVSGLLYGWVLLTVFCWVYA